MVRYTCVCKNIIIVFNYSITFMIIERAFYVFFIPCPLLIAHQKSKTALSSVSQPNCLNSVLLKLEYRKLRCIRKPIRLSQNKSFLLFYIGFHYLKPWHD